MIRSFDGKSPRIAKTAWVSEAAYVVGDVEIGEGSSVWPGAVIRADFTSIRIGKNSHIEDNCVLHGGEPLTIGDNIIAGHGVIIHCSSIGDNCLIGNNATLLDGAEIGETSIVAAGSLVLPGTIVPPRSFVVGSPAEIREATDDQLRFVRGLVASDSAYAEMARRFRKAGL